MCVYVWMSISRCSRHKTKNNNFYTVKHRREGIWLWILACLLVFTAPGQPVPPPPPSPSVYNILQTTSSRVEEREKIEIFFCFLISSSYHHHHHLFVIKYHQHFLTVFSASRQCFFLTLSKYLWFPRIDFSTFKLCVACYKILSN